MVFKHEWVSESPGGLVKNFSGSTLRVSDSVGLGWDSKICNYNKLSGNADDADLGNYTPRTTVLEEMMLNRWYEAYLFCIFLPELHSGITWWFLKTTNTWVLPSPPPPSEILILICPTGIFKHFSGDSNVQRWGPQCEMKIISLGAPGWIPTGSRVWVKGGSFPFKFLFSTGRTYIGKTRK